MRSALKNVDTFANISGLKVNVEKTNAVDWFEEEQLCKEIKVNWVDKGSFKALGVAFSTDLDSMVSLNYNKAIESLRKQIAMWSKRNLTVLGRVTVVKSLLLSKLTFLFCLFLIPLHC